MIKRQDIYLIVVMVIISSVIALIVSNILFKTEKVQTPVEVVEEIRDEFKAPDAAYFNKNSLNPTETIIIGDPNPNPF